MKLRYLLVAVLAAGLLALVVNAMAQEVEEPRRTVAHKADGGTISVDLGTSYTPTSSIALTPSSGKACPEGETFESIYRVDFVVNDDSEWDAHTNQVGNNISDWNGLFLLDKKLVGTANWIATSEHAIIKVESWCSADTASTVESLWYINVTGTRLDEQNALRLDKLCSQRLYTDDEDPLPVSLEGVCD